MSTMPQVDAFMTEEQELIADLLQQRMRSAALRLGIEDTKDLHDSIRAESVAAVNGQGKLLLYFQTVGRMVDMGAGKGYSKGKYIGNNPRTDLLKGRRARQFYTRPAYGIVYGQLITNLSNKFVEGLVNQAVKGLEA